MNITQTQYDIERRHPHGCLKLFVHNNVLTDIADKWFNDNEIYKMQIKSSAWAVILKNLLGTIEQKIAKHFGIDPKFVKYSRKCGCSCGCSPGYNVRLPAGHDQTNHDAWANVDTDIDGLDIASLEHVITHKVPKRLAKDRQKEVDICALAAQQATNHKEVAVA